MTEQLSLINTEQEISLDTKKEDVASVFLKGVSGIIPFGSLIGELIATVIPNQKFERVVDFVQVLNHKLKSTENKVEIQESKMAEITDLVEDALGQASRALSKERLEYIASLIKNSITKEDLSHLEKKRLLSILGQINDIEIIWLKYYSFKSNNFGYLPFKEFHDTHKMILKPTRTDMFSKSEDFERESIQESFKQNLLSLGLIEMKEKYKGLFTTRLGKAVLRYIDQLPTD